MLKFKSILSLIFEICTPSSWKKIMYFYDMTDKVAFLLTSWFRLYVYPITLEKKSYLVCIVVALSILYTVYNFDPAEKKMKILFIFKKKTAFSNTLYSKVICHWFLNLDEIGFCWNKELKSWYYKLLLCQIRIRGSVP